MVLQGAHNRHPKSVNILNALIAIHRDMRNREQAQTDARSYNSPPTGSVELTYFFIATYGYTLTHVNVNVV